MAYTAYQNRQCMSHTIVYGDTKTQKKNLTFVTTHQLNCPLNM